MECIYVLIAFCLGFMIAQTAKFILSLVSLGHEKGKLDLKTALRGFFRSGGMPSGHAASFTAATVCLGFIYGFGSGVFALAVCTTIIIIYDATHVRYAVGEQGKALNELLGEAKEPKLRLVEGHTVSQVIVGMLLGVGIALIEVAVAGI